MYRAATSGQKISQGQMWAIGIHIQVHTYLEEYSVQPLPFPPPSCLPCMQAGVVAQELNITRLQQIVKTKLITRCQAAKQLHSIQVLLGKAGHLGMTLTQLKVVFTIVDAQVTLMVVEDGDEEVGLTALGDFPLAIEKPGACEDTCQVGAALDDLVVHTDAGRLWGVGMGGGGWARGLTHDGDTHKGDAADWGGDVVDCNPCIHIIEYIAVVEYTCHLHT